MFLCLMLSRGVAGANALHYGTVVESCKPGPAWQLITVGDDDGSFSDLEIPRAYVLHDATYLRSWYLH
jgi:hypothetical protein